ncbi:hypothetical protein LTR27_010008 [Elasticomyces elasticus]|nr:hypothetical protein LTR27_010008 [Elasticomyces elasticus]
MATPATGPPASATVDGDPQEVTLIEEAMLGPHYLEGQAPRSAEQPKEVQLPDDDPNAMNVLLALIHFQDPDKKKALISPAELANLAVAVDKYDCITALALTTEALLKRCTEAGALPSFYDQRLAY